ncbi:DUF418 domain-containing protein [Neobacillus massiliamazoniensis]|uniref:Membrane-spanning protein n=1 Tax=Neobacillus massiliamazoniensis TaxID=1499688 RepID=A0A0U1NWC7_9BACI|nr:DUF418 domain-containing protein [Neobacillus massiliamazoniensis]CRK82326.1 membrane-spanning protein [Neobacillus massiliamazoniensis]
MNPIDESKRIDTLDYLRGFALMGIILVNILPLLSVKSPDPHSLDAAYQRFLYLLVEGRFYTIFSFLFGVGFYLFISRANQKGKNTTVLFVRRMLALFIFGIIHVQFHPGEALTVYALCGLFILPFYNAPKTVNLVISLPLLIVFAIFSIKLFMTLPLMLLGIAAGQYRIFEGISLPLKKVTIFTVLMFLGSMIGLGYQFQHAPEVLWKGKIEETQRFLDIGIAIGPMVSGFYVGLLLILLRLSFVRRLLSPIKKYGRMALTNYILQTVFILLSGSLFRLFARISYIQSLYLCFVIYVVQFIITIIWIRYFKFGPLEWVWRMVTYREVLPLRGTIKDRQVNV